MLSAHTTCLLHRWLAASLPPAVTRAGMLPAAICRVHAAQLTNSRYRTTGPNHS